MACTLDARILNNLSRKGLRWSSYRNDDAGRPSTSFREGEKSTTVVFWKFANGTAENQDGDSDEVSSGSRLLFTRGYSVFNAAQVDGYTPKADELGTELERIERAEKFFAGIGADLRHDGNRAYYTTGDDHIQMPMFNAFTDNVAYYSTLAHEHTHWTSKSERCDRQLGKRFGDSAYAAEELIAELGAAFTCATLGLSTEPREDHAQYINSWLKVLKADKRAIFTAASHAQRAVDFLHGLQEAPAVPEAAE